MSTNIEIKARIHNFEALKERLETLSDTPPERIRQEDSFFHVPQGRLKLRLLAPDRGQLIYYEREDIAGPKQSHYIIYPTNTPDSLKAILAAALGLRGVVRKERLLFTLQNTRIHLDQVEGLGSFLEFEVVLSPGQTARQGQATANELMARLGVEPDNLIEGAYIDLLSEISA